MVTTPPSRAPRPEAQQLERIPTEIFPSSEEACRLLAAEMAALVRARQKEGCHVVFGLATGSTPVRLYRELIRLHREEKLSFANVITFNLDEYYGLVPTHPESYARFMSEQLFAHIDIPTAQIHIPDGTVKRQDVYDFCARYEAQIAEAGGLDLQILGIGRTGHIGFNEPGSGPESRTRLVTLDSLTRRDAARDFLGEANVPRHAITMGVGTILGAREIVLMAWGEGKAAVVAQAVEHEPSDTLPASFLQAHPNVRFLVDAAAAGELTRVRYPWRVGDVAWNPELIRRAVLWLAERRKKPVLRLVDEEYNECGLAELLLAHGPAYDLNISVFNQLQHTITGWPGGKPKADDASRPERALPFPKRALVLSPEPQDDVVSLGGTLHRLQDQQHEVTVVYQTSGNLAVPDEDVLRAAELVLELGEKPGEQALQPVDARVPDGAPAGPARALAGEVRKQLLEKGAFESDPPNVRRFKGLIRRGEARAGCRLCGVSADRVRFLDLPFYENGRYRQFHLGDEDVARMTTLLRELQPHQIYLTGLMADPSSVAALAFAAFRRAWEEVRREAWAADCRVWLYRGSGQEWETHEIDMAVPLSPGELAAKVQGIYQHQSQRSQTPLGPDKVGETWQQAEVGNRATAMIYDRLGLAEYEAIEAFKRWRED